MKPNTHPPLVLLLHGEDARPAGHLLHHQQHRAAAPDAALVIVQLLWTFVHFWKLCLVLCQRQTFHSLWFSVKETLLSWCTLPCPFHGKVLTAQVTPKELSFMHHSKQIPWEDHLTACHFCITQNKFYKMTIFDAPLKSNSMRWTTFIHHSKQSQRDEHLTAASLRLQRWVMARRSVTQTRSFFDLTQFLKLFKAFNL